MEIESYQRYSFYNLYSVWCDISITAANEINVCRLFISHVIMAMF